MSDSESSEDQTTIIYPRDDPINQPIHSRQLGRYRCRFCNCWPLIEHWEWHVESAYHHEQRRIASMLYNNRDLNRRWGQGSHIPAHQRYRGERPGYPLPVWHRLPSIPRQRRNSGQLTTATARDNVQSAISQDNLEDARVREQITDFFRVSRTRTAEQHARQEFINETRHLQAFFIGEDEQEPCGTCLEPFTIDAEVAIYPCGCRLCVSCYNRAVSTWRNGRYSCPICREGYGADLNKPEIEFATLQPDYTRKMCALSQLSTEEQRTWNMLDRLAAPTTKSLIRSRMKIIASDFGHVSKSGNLHWVERFKGTNWFASAQFDAARNCINALSRARGYQDVHVVPTDLYNAISSRRVNQTLASRIFDRVAVDIHTLSRILVPCNVTGNHWVLIVIHIRRRQFQKYNPSGSDDSSDQAAIKVQTWFMNNVLRIKKTSLVGKPGDYSVVHCASTFPVQRDISSCGPYTIYVMACLACGHTPTVVEDPELLRARIFLWMFNLVPWIQKHAEIWETATSRRNLPRKVRKPTEPSVCSAASQIVMIDDSPSNASSNRIVGMGLRPKPIPYYVLKNLNCALDTNFDMPNADDSREYIRLVCAAGFRCEYPNFDFMISIPKSKIRPDALRLLKYAEENMFEARKYFDKTYTKSKLWLIPETIDCDRTYARDLPECLYLLEQQNIINVLNDPSSNSIDENLRGIYNKCRGQKRWFSTPKGSSHLLRSVVYSYHAGRFVPPDIFETVPLQRIDKAKSYIGLPRDFEDMQYPLGLLVHMPEVSYYYAQKFTASSSNSFHEYVRKKITSEYAYNIYNTWVNEATRNRRGYVLPAQVIDFLHVSIDSNYIYMNLNKEQVFKQMQIVCDVKSQCNILKVHGLEHLSTFVLNLPQDLFDPGVAKNYVNADRFLYVVTVSDKRARLDFRNYRKRCRSKSRGRVEN